MSKSFITLKGLKQIYYSMYCSWLAIGFLIRVDHIYKYQGLNYAAKNMLTISAGKEMITHICSKE